MGTQKTLRKAAMLKGEKGFSMTELVIAMAIALIAAVGIYSVYVGQQRQSSSQRLYNDLQNNLRFAMDYMKSELLLAGFNATNSLQPIKTATSSTISFEYWDEDAGESSPYSNHVLVTYFLDGDELKRGVKKYNTVTGNFEPTAPGVYALSNVLATDVTGLAFSYRRSNDEVYVIGTNSEDEIRTVRLSLSGRSRRADPLLKDPSTGGDFYRTLTLTGEVRSRNLAIAANPFDTDPPAIPSGLNVWDSQECGRLLMEWDANGEPDLAGYTVFYGLTPGNYIGRMRLSRGPGTGKENYTLTGLAAYDTPYYIAIGAFDRSGNMSNLSAEVSGDPTPDVTSPGGADDTTVNPTVPAPPVNVAYTAPADGQVQLTWDLSPTAGVVGYRLFRATEADFGDEVLVANEAILAADSTGHLDTGLVGCKTYYYRIASIHCDASVFPGDYTYTTFDADDDDYATLTAVPIDGVPPSTPVLYAKAGYRRVILNLENPDRGAEPDFTHTKIWFSTAGYPAIDAAGAVTGGTLIPDHGSGDPAGTFSTDGSVPPIKFDSETQAAPSQPELDENSTYFFIAVAYDECGNHTEVTDEASDLGVQCGDCDATEVCYEAPPYPTGITREGCATSVRLNWDTIDDVAYRDLAGFRVFRREGAYWSTSDPATEVELTGGNATWFTTWQNTTTSAEHPMEMKKVYSYSICAVDCYYEQHAGKSPGDWPDPANDPDDNLACTSVDGVYVGTFDESSPPFDWAVTGDLIDLPPNLRHNEVTVWFDNLAAGPLTQEVMSLDWTNPEAFIRRVVIGDNSTTSEDVIEVFPPLPTGSNVIFTPPKRIDGLDDRVPMSLTFTRSDGTVDGTVDMRQELLTPRIDFTNESTGDSSCTYIPSTLLGTSIFVPLGPVVTGAIQNQPSAPTVSWPVPGDGGVNVVDQVIVKGNRDVNVRATVLPDSITGGGLVSVTLRYFVDTGNLGLVPAAGDFNNVIDMIPEAGNQWVTATPIPASNDSSVWYYILAVDGNGNFDREPEISAVPGSVGAFQYYQQPANVCDDIPGQVPLSGTALSTDVTLTWSKPLFSTDPELPGVLLPFEDDDGYRVYRSSGGGWAVIAEVDKSTFTYVDSPPDIDTLNYSYYVTAIDTCPNPGPVEGPPSDIFTECIGAPACTLTVSPSGAVPMFPGDALTISVTVCEKQNEIPDEIIYAQTCSAVGGAAVGGPDADPVQLVEGGDTGTFSIDAGLYGRTFVRTYLNADYPASPSEVDLLVAENDTITVGAWSDTAYSGSSCLDLGGAAGLFTCGAQVFPVTPDPCAAPMVPEAPTGLAVFDAIGNCNSSREVNLDWTASPSADVSVYEIYRCPDASCSTAILIGFTTDTAFGPHSVGAKLNTDTFYFRVRAVNRTCPTDFQYSPFTPAVVDPCP